MHRGEEGRQRERKKGYTDSKKRGSKKFEGDDKNPWQTILIFLILDWQKSLKSKLESFQKEADVKEKMYCNQ